MTDPRFISRVLVLCIVVVLVSPSAAAHGANTFSFILRSESVNPESAQVLQNDTLIFYNVVDYERNISLEGPYGEEVCTAGPSSPGIEDECRFWLDPEKYGPETYGIQIFSNGSWWKEVVVTVVLDNHTEVLPPDGFVFEPEPNESEDLGRFFLSAAVLLAGAAALMRISRDKKGDEEE
ncbi:MAG: hypothetical protein CMA47_02920 [Euryarchaeota archaeon]|nr:hypothetical protein [Euryarchaeota archaeon]